MYSATAHFVYVVVYQVDALIWMMGTVALEELNCLHGVITQKITICSITTLKISDFI
jgi:hypothetical protein